MCIRDRALGLRAHRLHAVPTIRRNTMAEVGMTVTKLATKSHDNADEVRTPSKTRVEVVRLPDFTMARLNLDPGWKWSECIKPVVGTESCQVAHVGYAVSGRLTVRLNDGTQKTFEPGMSY